MFFEERMQEPAYHDPERKKTAEPADGNRRKLLSIAHKEMQTTSGPRPSDFSQVIFYYIVFSSDFCTVRGAL